MKQLIIKSGLIALSSLMIAEKTIAQEPNFSQFFNVPLTVNPAYAGTAPEIMQLSGTIRHTSFAGNTPFMTGVVSLNTRLFEKQMPASDKIGLGVLMMFDRSNAGALNTSYMGLSLAYHKSLDAHNTLGAGFQTTVVNRRLDFSKLTFEDQFTSGGFNGGTSDAYLSNSLLYVDFNAGLLFRHAGDKYKYYLGASTWHISKPKEEVITTAATQPRYTINAGGEWKINEESNLQTHWLFNYRSGANEFVYGLIYVRELTHYNNVKFYGGAFMRMNDALYPYVAFDYRQFHFGLSYDVTVSQQRIASSNKQSFELTVIYSILNPKKEALPE